MLAWILHATFLIGSVLLTSTFIARFHSTTKHQRLQVMAKLSDEKPCSYMNTKNTSSSSRPPALQFVPFDDVKEEYEEEYTEPQRVQSQVTMTNDNGSSKVVKIKSFEGEDESEVDEWTQSRSTTSTKEKSFDFKPTASKGREKVSDKEYDAHWKRLEGKRKRNGPTREQIIQAYYSLDKNQTLAQKAIGSRNYGQSKEWDYQVEPTSNADLIKLAAAAFSLSAVFVFISKTLG